MNLNEVRKLAGLPLKESADDQPMVKIEVPKYLFDQSSSSGDMEAISGVCGYTHLCTLKDDDDEEVEVYSIHGNKAEAQQLLDKHGSDIVSGDYY